MSNVQERDLCSHAVRLNTDRYVRMAPITQCCKAPPLAANVLRPPISSGNHSWQHHCHHITLQKPKKPQPSEGCSLVTQKPVSVYIRREKKSSWKRNTIQDRKKQLFFFYIPEIPNGWCRRHSLWYMPVNNESHESTWIQASMILLWVVVLAVTGMQLGYPHFLVEKHEGWDLHGLK